MHGEEIKNNLLWEGLLEEVVQLVLDICLVFKQRKKSVAENSNSDGNKTMESRNRACEWCTASCLEVFGTIRKAPKPDSEVGPL